MDAGRLTIDLALLAAAVASIATGTAPMVIAPAAIALALW